MNVGVPGTRLYYLACSLGALSRQRSLEFYVLIDGTKTHGRVPQET